MTDNAYFMGRLRDTYDTLDSWRDRLQEGFRPTLGSELYEDDQLVRWSPASQYAWFGLGSARDHLNAVRSLIEAKQLCPSAHPTLIRGALVGASQAVWILESDEASVRQTRAALMARESYSRHGQFAGDIAKKRGVLLARETEVWARKRVAELEAMGVTGRIVVTDVVDRAAVVTYESEHPELVADVSAVWQQTSGSAHGLPWSLAGKPGTRQVSEDDEDGLAVFEAGGHLEDVVGGYLAAYWIAVKGWQLFDHRNAVTQP